jgi:CO/xanthine dehydrogenase FAD-binding subunit
MGLYLRPRTIEEAVAALAESRFVVLAGGTDFYPTRVGRALDENVVDITAVAALRGIHRDGDGWHIGATTTWRDVLDTPLPPLFDGLKLAAREVGGPQIQNAATVAGNLCNASPAADSVPVLMALDARLELRSAVGSRVLPIADFIRGNRRTAARPDELLSAILVPHCPARAAGHFLKLGARRYLVISIAMVAGIIALDAAGRIIACRIAIGACSEVAQGLPALEQALLGRHISDSPQDAVEPQHFAALRPIDDVRASADYRRDGAMTLTRRLLHELVTKLAEPYRDTA